MCVSAARSVDCDDDCVDDDVITSSSKHSRIKHIMEQKQQILSLDKAWLKKPTGRQLVGAKSQLKNISLPLGQAEYNELSTHLHDFENIFEFASLDLQDLNDEDFRTHSLK